MRHHPAEAFRHAHGRIALIAVAGAALLAAALIPVASASTRAKNVKNPICSRLGQIGLSAGAHMYCQGPVKTTGSGVRNSRRSSSAPKNVNAAHPREDVSPSGARAYGQSEESVAAVGSYVVEAWNDSTGFQSSCGAPNYKEELTGYGFSANGGKKFHDEGGLPNNLCSSGWLYEGDPSVVGWTSGGVTYFYISSLFDNIHSGHSAIALDACTVNGTGSSATLACNTAPTLVATGALRPFPDFLDKDFLALDKARNRLYATYTRFSASAFNGQIELAVCDIAGSSAGNPTCYPGRSEKPYYVVQTSDPNCEHEGAYPAVDPATGDVYVAWEFNWATNFENPACYSTPTQERLAYIPNSCLTLPASTCTSPAPAQATIDITSMDAAFIPGYNRFPMSDFPRIAVSDKSNTVTIVWNDGARHATGDILMQSYGLGASLTPVQSKPVRLNNNKGKTWVFMPALRNADKSGLLDVVWYDRRNSSPSCEACTDLYAALKVSPTATKKPTSNVRITNVSSNWNAVSSDIVPNFGDYTDDLVVGKSLYAAWADGRLGVPQPFFAKTGG